MSNAKHEVLEDGWTRVCGKKSAPREVRTSGIPPPTRDLTLDKLLSNFNAKMKIWQSSSSREEIHKMLDRKQPDDGWNFNKAICLASGSFSRDNWENSKRSMFQFVFFLDTVRHLRATSSTSIEMFAQDPMHVDLDKEFLSYHGVNVLEMSWDDDPQDLGPAKDHLGPQTVVFELFMDMAQLAMRQLFESDLLLHVGSPFKSWLLDRKQPDEDKLRNTYRKRGFDEVSVRQSVTFELEKEQLQRTLVKEFLNRRRSLYFPRFEEDPLVFEGLMFHWKEQADDEDEDDT